MVCMSIEYYLVLADITSSPFTHHSLKCYRFILIIKKFGMVKAPEMLKA